MEVRCVTVAAVLSLFSAFSASPAAAEKQDVSAGATQNVASPAAKTPAPAAVSPAEINTWIAKLDDDRYQVREDATQRLISAGDAALDSLKAAADKGRPEPSDRSVWILRRISTAKDRELRRQALMCLSGLKQRPQVAAAAHDALAEMEHEEAVEAIEKLGARYIPRGEYVMQIGSSLADGVLLDERWKGHDADLVHLPRVRELRQVMIVGTDTTLDGLKELQRCPMLIDVHLWGTKLTADDVAKLRKMLPESVKIDYRYGALLGVKGVNSVGDMAPAIVEHVEPGSAAATAGIQARDVIQKLDGESIANFAALTQKIGLRHPGDEVTIDLLREGKPVQIKVKLGKWKTIEVD